MKDKKLTLYGCCYPVRGFSRSIICDLQYGKINYIPNDLFDLLKESAGKTKTEIFEYYNNEENETIDEYLEYLIENGYIFYSDEPENFPPLHKKWSAASEISNMIIDVDSNNIILNKKFVNDLDSFGSLSIQLRVNDFITYEKLDSLLSLFYSSRLKSIELVLKYDAMLIPLFDKLTTKHLRVSYIIQYLAPENDKIEFDNFICFNMTETLTDATRNGPISVSHLAINKHIFMESQFHHTYFNSKLYIDELGNLSNAPGTDMLGNIKTDNLNNIIHYTDVRKYWNITKDTTKVCKDCEYRYFCVDARTPLLNSETNEYYHQAKCNYNPYTTTWDHE
ncbi:MAG: grasp-with-spasm system SPASM domain peptide maturase [Flavobacterium sp.]|nr:grasp-with-spasm system SPASM domain peptide maturase [Flavobacterium sp.]